MESITIKVFRGKEGFHEIKNDWDRIVDKIPHKHLFHSYQWYKSYFETLKGADFNSIFVVMYKDDAPLALFPIESCVIGNNNIDNLPDFKYLSDGKNEIGNVILGLVFLARFLKVFGFRLRILQIPHCRDVDYGDFICTAQENNEVIMGFLIDCLKAEYHWDFFILPNVTENSCVSHVLKSSSYTTMATEKKGESFYLQGESYEEITKKFSKKFRRNLNNARNRLSRLGNFKYISVRKKDDLKWAFQEFLEIEASGWKGEAGDAIKQHWKLKTFYKNLFINFSETQRCEINLLMINNKSIAGLLCILTDDTIYFLKIAYDEKYSSASPGILLLEDVIKRYSNDSLFKNIDMMSGYQWTERWKPLSVGVSNIVIFNNSLLGSISFFFIKYALQWELHSKYIKPTISRCRLFIKSMKKRGRLNERHS